MLSRITTERGADHCVDATAAVPRPPRPGRAERTTARGWQIRVARTRTLPVGLVTRTPPRARDATVALRPRTVTGRGFPLMHAGNTDGGPGPSINPEDQAR